MASLIYFVAMALVCRVLWFLLHDYFVRSPLDTIPGPPSDSIFAGNMLQMNNRNSWGFVRGVCETYGPVAKIHAFFGSRWLHIYDPKAIHHILIKDADVLYGRDEQSVGGSRLFFGMSLLGTTGEHHRKQRKMLTPVFSAAHMRNMTPMFYRICSKLHEAIESRVMDGPRELDMLSWMGRTALELVGQGGFGHSFDPLVEDSKDGFTEAVKAFVPAFSLIAKYQAFFPYVNYLGPAWFRRFLLDMVPMQSIQTVKTLVDKIQAGAKQVFDEKKKAVESGDQELLHTISEGKDILSIMLRENILASEDDKLPDSELLAQLSTLLVAGVDTTSNALSRSLNLLSLNPDVQTKLRAELVQAQETYGRDIPYDELSALPYLDAVCRETLRLYAPVPYTPRQAKQDAVLPLSQPIRTTDGKTVSEIPVPKGTIIMINPPACNANKALWGEDAYEWKPERWLQPLPRAVEDARIPGIYANLMTFIGGGYACIGFKFSQLEMKIVLSILVSSFKFELSRKPIVWNFAGVTFPAASLDTNFPEMNLVVSKA